MSRAAGASSRGAHDMRPLGCMFTVSGESKRPRIERGGDMSRYVHTGITVTAIGTAAAAVAPIGSSAAPAYAVAVAGAALTLTAGFFEWCERRELRAATAAERAARRIERITARASARVDAVAARAVRAEALRVAVADAVGGVDRVDAVTGEVSDGVRFVVVDEDGAPVHDDTATAGGDAEPAPRGDFGCCERGEHETATTTGAGA